MNSKKCFLESDVTDCDGDGGWVVKLDLVVVVAAAVVAVVDDALSDWEVCVAAVARPPPPPTTTPLWRFCSIMLLGTNDEDDTDESRARWYKNPVFTCCFCSIDGRTQLTSSFVTIIVLFILEMGYWEEDDDDDGEDDDESTTVATPPPDPV
jgi:hypothetical protein